MNTATTEAVATVITTVTEAVVEAEATRNLRTLESALNRLGLEADLRMRRTTEEHIEIPGYGIVVLGDSHSNEGWWVRDLDQCDVSLEAEELIDELVKLVEMAQAVA